jgi:hypothetical protein
LHVFGYQAPAQRSVGAVGILVRRAAAFAAIWSPRVTARIGRHNQMVLENDEQCDAL